MFRCERCGTGFSANQVDVSDDCTRCKSKGRTSAPLVFAPFQGRHRQGVRAAIEARVSLDQGRGLLRPRT